MAKKQAVEEVTGQPPIADEMELPPPPPLSPETAATGAEASAGFDVADVPADLSDAIPEAPEAMPKGVSEFILKSFQKKRSAETAQGANDGKPYFNVEWACQTEPNVGRRCYDMIPWVDAWVIKDANDTTSPTMQQSRQELKDRLWKIKSCMKSAGWDMRQGLKPEAFFATEPLVKIDHGQKERQQKGPIVSGKQTYVSFNPPQYDTKVNRYVPLHG